MQAGDIRACGPIAGHDDDIQTSQFVLVAAKAFPRHTFDPVAAYRGADLALSDRQSQPGVVKAVFCHDHAEDAVAAAPAFIKDAFKLNAFQQSLLPSEPTGACLLGSSGGFGRGTQESPSVRRPGGRGPWRGGR